MAISFGSARIIKEMKIEINNTFEVGGFIDLVSKGKVTLAGKLEQFNDKTFEECKRVNQKFPIIIQFKQKELAKENENLWKDSLSSEGSETPEEYLKYFEGNIQKIKSIQLLFKLGSLRIIVFSEPYGKWRASVENLKTIEVLEEKNVPHL